MGDVDAMGRTALLIADLEGVAFVDSLDALGCHGEGYADACARMTQEVNAAIEGLLTQGFAQVRVSDTHRSGSGRSNLGALHSAASVHRVDPDSYGGALMDGVEAVACVGMHAAGGTKGFAAHTVEVHTVWLLAGRPISETELVFWLAADRGIPVVFASGDDVLGASVIGLAAYVVTKQSTAVDSATSNDVVGRIRSAAASQPRSIAQAPEGPITVRFKTGSPEQNFDGPTFTARYLAALNAVIASEAELAGVANPASLFF